MPAERKMTNPWLGRRPLNFAHQGGALEAPSNTLYAFKTAVSLGADALEMDVHSTEDRHIVVMHDATVDRTTNGSGAIDRMKLDELKHLDAAYWWAPGFVTVGGLQEEEYLFRGVSTGSKPPPNGYSSEAFTIPTLREVLETFPHTYINMEIKQTLGSTEPYEREVADLLREFERTEDVIVASFNDLALHRFREIAPEITTSAATVEATEFWEMVRGSGKVVDPRYSALQLPNEFGGVRVLDRNFIESAHAAGVAVHAWTVDEEELMTELLGIGIDGIITDRPTLLGSVIRGRVAK